MTEKILFQIILTAYYKKVHYMQFLRRLWIFLKFENPFGSSKVMVKKLKICLFFLFEFFKRRKISFFNITRQGVMFIVTNETLVFSLVFHLPKLKPKLIFKLFFRQIGVFNTVFNVPMTQWLKTLVRKFGLTHIILLQ